MHVHLLVPDLLRNDLLAPDLKGFAPAAAYPAPPSLPSAERLLARGRRKAVTTGAYGWLAGRHALPEKALTAATSLLGDGGTPGTECWLRADPVQLTVDRDALVLADAAVFTLSAEEAVAFAATINAHFAPTLCFEVTAPLRWYAKLNEGPDNASDLHWTHARDARGQAIRRTLPQGPGALHWNAIANEVQMLLHEHPVNAARQARGEPMINSLWFWGAGSLSAPEKRPFAHVYADDPVARGLTMAAGSSAAALPASAEAWLRDHAGQAEHAGRVLFVLDGLAAPAAYADREQWSEQAGRLERDWLVPLLEALRNNRIGMLTLALPGARDAEAGTTGEAVSGAEVTGVEVEVVRGDLRRFWRRVKPLRHYVAGATG